MTNGQTALDFIIAHCPHVGAFHGPPEVQDFLKDTAREMAAAAPSVLFPHRYREHVAYALDQVASHHFTSSPAAIASLYLATRFEFYFRVLSKKMNGDGTWLSRAKQQAAQKALKDNRLGLYRLSDVKLTYRVMKLGRSKVARACRKLDAALYKRPQGAVGGTQIAHVGDRIAFGRNAASHGQWGDVSAEALFYGLLTAVVFYEA